MIEVDTHVHTVLSGHAFSTIQENIQFAKKHGLKGFCSTDHGPHIPGSCPNFVPYTMRTWPEYFDDIRVYKSCEANIIGIDGKIDIPRIYIDMLEFVSAGIHMVDTEVFTKENVTNAYIEAYSKDYFDVVTHMDNVYYACDYNAVIEVAKSKGKPIEINNQSFQLRKGSKEEIIKILNICKQTRTNILVASDSHICYNIGDVSKVEQVILDNDFPQELILNSNFEKFDDYIKSRAKRLKKA